MHRRTPTHCRRPPVAGTDRPLRRSAHHSRRACAVPPTGLSRAAGTAGSWPASRGPMPPPAWPRTASPSPEPARTAGTGRAPTDPGNGRAGSIAPVPACPMTAAACYRASSAACRSAGMAATRDASDRPGSAASTTRPEAGTSPRYIGGRSPSAAGNLRSIDIGISAVCRTVRLRRRGRDPGRGSGPGGRAAAPYAAARPRPACWARPSPAHWPQASDWPGAEQLACSSPPLSSFPTAGHPR